MVEMQLVLEYGSKIQWREPAKSSRVSIRRFSGQPVLAASEQGFLVQRQPVAVQP